MNRGGKESAQLNKLEDYLKKLGLLESRNSFPNSDFSIGAVRGLQYCDVWKKHINNQWYDIRLDDNSLLYFYRDRNGVSFSYLGCPYVCEPFRIYKAKQEFVDYEDSFIQELYEDELNSSVIKPNPDYFRYDYEESSYKPGKHPVSHLHCGLMENVRFGVVKELDIMSFSALVLRQVYIQEWETVLEDELFFHELHVCKEGLPDIKPDYYQKTDIEKDFYFV